MEYFSEKESRSKPQIVDKVTVAAWGGIVALIQSLLATGAFGFQYPEMCPDGNEPIGTDEQSFLLALKAEVPDIEWPLQKFQHESFEEKAWAPETAVALDLIQFCYKAVAKPIRGGYHTFFRHHHLSFDEGAGKDSFLEKINTIFRRNGIAFVLEYDGAIKRIIPEQFNSFISTHILTGDSVLDNMIDDAQKKFLNPDKKIRKEAIERLWDCWERLKTIEDPTNKKKSISILLNKSSTDPNIRSMLEEGAVKLTGIGNKFHIRHSEVTQTLISDNSIIDYLFYRLFAFIQMLISSR
jgi:hypothetical protein